MSSVSFERMSLSDMIQTAVVVGAVIFAAAQWRESDRLTHSSNERIHAQLAALIEAHDMKLDEHGKQLNGLQRRVDVLQDRGIR